MKIVVLGGYGEMGSIAVLDLVETCKNCEIVVAGRDTKKARNFANSFRRKNVKYATVDVSDIRKTAKLLKGSMVVINATQYYNNLKVMRAALQAGVHYVDLGGLFHMTRKQLKLHQKFKKKNLLAVLGCGATPGITNVLAAHGAKFFDKINEIQIKFAGYDYTKYKTHLVIPYSAYTLFEEFKDKPAVFTKGKIKFVEPLSGEQENIFPEPVGKVKSYYSLHSELATFPSSFKNKGIRECSFRVSFDPHFIHDIKLLIEIGLAEEKPIWIDHTKVEPIKVTAKELNRFMTPENVKIKDIEYLRVEIFGKIKGKNKKLTVDAVARSNPKWNKPAGSVDTGVPLSIIAQMITKGQIEQKGVLPPELCIEPKIFFKELGKRRIEVYTKFE